MKTYVVSLDSHDDVISARDKISWSKANRVLLVWPRRGKVLERRVDLQILQRYAQSLGAQIAVVAGSSLVRGNARDLGIPVFATAEKAHEVPWRRRRRRRNWLRRGTPSHDALSLREQWTALREKKVMKPIFRLAVFGVGLAAFFSLVLLFFPSAQIRLVPEQRTQQFSVPVRASTNIQTPNVSGALPSQAISVVVEGRGLQSSTGQVRIPDRTATGQVTFTNLTDRSVSVPSGSTVITLDRRPKRFITTRDALVPVGPGQTVRVPVRAETAGSSGNVEAGKIAALEGQIGLQLSVENDAPISGGRDRLSPSPTTSDYRNLREKLLAELEGTAGEEINSLVGDGQILLPGTLQLTAVIEETRLPEAGQPGDQLQLVLRAEFQAMTALEADIEALAKAVLDVNLTADYQPVPASLDYSLVGISETGPDSAGNARWELRGERTLAPTWSTVDLAQAVRGRSLSQAVDILQTRLPLEEMPEIYIFPEWWPRLPFLPFRIELVQP